MNVNKTARPPARDAESYPGFNEDLIQMVQEHGELPWGASRELTDLAEYANRSTVSHFLRWARSEKQQQKKPSLKKLLGKSSLAVVRILGLDRDEKATASLLTSTNRSELERSFARFFRGTPEPLELLSWGCGASAAFGPSVDNSRLSRFFCDRIEGSFAPLVITAPPHVGASHSFHALQSSFGSRRRLLHVSPSASHGEVPEAEILKALADFLHLKNTENGMPSLQLPRAIINWAQENKVCIVVHNAQLVKGQGNRGLLALFQEATQAARATAKQQRKSGQDGNPSDASPALPFMIVHYPSGQDPSALSMGSVRARKAEYVPYGIGTDPLTDEPLDADSRKAVESELVGMIEYVNQSDPDATQRGVAYMEQGPSRVRVRRQMERLLRAGLKPSRTSLLIRAAAMTDRRILVPDDPTLGLRQLVGSDADGRLPEFARLRNDVLSSIYRLPNEQLRALRIISTSIHWITREMLEDLAQHTNNPAAAQHCSWASIETLIEMPNYALASWYIEPDYEDKTRARATIAVKSVIQDAWRESDPLSYVAVHIELARNLMRLTKLPEADAARRFNTEYHFAKMPEGPKSVFAFEAVRYASRAFEVAHSTAPTVRGALTKEERSATIRACKDVVEDALNTLGFELAQDARRFHRSNYALSRQYGRYLAKLELLHMLSVGNLGSRPSDLLPHSLHEEFCREVGIARFGMLDMDGAMSAFLDGACDETLSPEIRMDCMLHGASVAAAAHSFSTALSLADACDRLAFLGEKEYMASYQARAQVRRGLVARERGQLDHAYRVFGSVLKSWEPIPMEGDRAIACVDLLIEMGRLGHDTYEDAMMLAQLNSNELHRRDLFYEAARFDIRSAQIMARTNLPMSGEAILDDIGIQLLASGGSPRLHLEFMLACAEVLFFQEAYEWAYAAYIEPGLNLSSERGHRSFLRRFAQLGQQCLTNMQQRTARWLMEGADEHRARMLSLLRRERGLSGMTGGPMWPSGRRSSLLRNQYRNFREAPYDPQHGFDLELPFDLQEEWAERLADPAFVTSALARCESESAPPQDTHAYCKTRSASFLHCATCTSEY